MRFFIILLLLVSNIGLMVIFDYVQGILFYMFEYYKVLIYNYRKEDFVLFILFCLMGVYLERKQYKQKQSGS